MAVRFFKKRSVNQLRELGRNALATYCTLELIDEESKSIGQPSDPAKGKHLLALTGKVGLDGYLLGDTPARTASAVVMRTAALADNRFDQEAEPCEDYELWLRILAANPDGYFYGMPDHLLDYRIRESQLTSNTVSVFETLDGIFARFVPLMKDPTARWQVYEYAGSGAQARGCSEYAEHFWAIARELANNSDSLPSLLTA